MLAGGAGAAVGSRAAVGTHQLKGAGLKEMEMQRRELLKSSGLAAGAALAAGARLSAARTAFVKAKDYKKEPFRRMVIMGESTVQGGSWLRRKEDRYADIVANLINACQDSPMEYYNKGIGANAISPRSPGFEKSKKPSALERYQTDVIDLKPDLFILAYGLNDMRAAMPVAEFREDMATIIRDVQKACSPVTVLTTVYYMTGWKSFPPYNQGSIELTQRYNDCIRELAAKFRCLVADVWSGEGGADWLIHYDGVHGNKVGNLVIAHRLFEVIARHSSGLTNQTFAQEQDTAWTQRTMKARAEAGDPFRKTW